MNGQTHSQKDSQRAHPPRKRALTLTEVMVAMGISGLLIAAVLSQWVRSTSLALNAAETLEHVRSSREIIARVAQDVISAQRLTIYTAFNDRATPRRDGELGNYLAIQQLDTAGTITRTMGYYLQSATGGGWNLYRHDSADGGGLAVDTLPADTTAGNHRLIARAVNLPAANNLFLCLRDRAVSIRGEFGVPGAGKRGRSEFIQATFATRS